MGLDHDLRIACGQESGATLNADLGWDEERLSGLGPGHRTGPMGVL